MGIMYVHSRCCMAHWELVYVGGEWDLVCEKCGRPIGSGIKVVGPKIACECELCKKEQGPNE